jgi:hypothetical protein
VFEEALARNIGQQSIIVGTRFNGGGRSGFALAHAIARPDRASRHNGGRAIVRVRPPNSVVRHISAVARPSGPSEISSTDRTPSNGERMLDAPDSRTAPASCVHS